MAQDPADLARSTSQQGPLRLRLAFEASSLRGATAVASELKLIAGSPARIYPTEPLPGAATSTGSQTWSVELTTPPMPLMLPAIHMWERKMLSLEYRCPGCRFLGWTTDEIPAASARRLEATREPVDHSPPRTQRELVAESLRRRPSAAYLGIVHGRRPLR